MNWSKSSTKAVEKVSVPSKKRLKNIELIKKHEGLRLRAYLPTPNDRWTIGYGHTKTAKQGMKITAEEAEELLRQDLDWVEDVIDKYVKVPLTQNQYDALGSLIFNIGEGNFSNSTVLRRLNEAKYEEAAEAFKMWNKQRSKTTNKMVPLKGLTIRREEERKLFLA